MLTITRAEAAPIIAKALEEGQISPGFYYRSNRSRCAIGHLFTEEEAQLLENHHLAETPEELRFVEPLNKNGYALVGGLIDSGVLVVDDRDWFVSVQRAVDGHDWHQLESLLSPQET